VELSEKGDAELGPIVHEGRFPGIAVTNLSIKVNPELGATRSCTVLDDIPEVLRYGEERAD
jgi:hypothetical protein